MSEHDLMLKMQNYLPVETQDLLSELTAERALKQRQFDAVLAERAALPAPGRRPGRPNATSCRASATSEYVA